MSTGIGYWDQKYGRTDYVYGRRPNQFLVDHGPDQITPGGQVLSLGEGEGRNAVWLAGWGWEVTAVDYSRAALEKLRRHAREQNVSVETHCQDVLDFDLGKELWDAVILLHLHLLPERRRALHRRVIASLRPGGVLMVEGLHIDQVDQPSGGPEMADILYTTDELRRDFGELDIELLENRERYIDAGEHRGMTSVVRLIARKK